MTPYESYQLQPKAGLSLDQHLEDIDTFILQARERLNSLIAEQVLLRQVLGIETIVPLVEEPTPILLTSVIIAA
jgi:hypothetical protein